MKLCLGKVHCKNCLYIDNISQINTIKFCPGKGRYFCVYRYNILQIHVYYHEILSHQEEVINGKEIQVLNKDVTIVPGTPKTPLKKIC